MSTELPYTPPITLLKTDHGIDGLDAKTWPVAQFTTRDKAMAYLKKRGFTHPAYGGYYHEDINRRNTMGAISYEIRESQPALPVDPQ